MSENAKKNFKDTIQLPQTTFPMRGDLVQKEPDFVQKWQDEELYNRIYNKRKAQGAPKFVLHDGPPFANGDVHMGTALNKTLKDLVIKSKTMAGFAAPYVPGWDCHGLPIEYKVTQDAKNLETAEIRKRCAEFASGWIDTQRESFKRLGVLANWEDPYLTMSPGYEASILRVFKKLVERGAVYQSRKPVLWSFGAGTALAEAEIEYQDKTSPAIWVKFNWQPKEETKATISGLSDDLGLVIWTTTPWTLPANLAVAVHERIEYVVANLVGVGEANSGQVQQLLLAQDLVEDFCEKCEYELKEVIATIKGSDLEGSVAQHPFMERESPVVLGDFVTTESGTGIVHIAPGHGTDDYMVGQKYNLGLLSPVDDGGCYTDECGIDELVGLHVFKGNAWVIEHLAGQQALMGQMAYKHSYPYCWRSKKPVIFRAVEQFFISLAKTEGHEQGLREQALEQIDQVEWLPHWGRNRIYGTVESRPDWCVSRQRTWGVPVPAFFAPDGQVILEAELIEKIAARAEKEGCDFWFELSDEQLAANFDLPAGTKRGRDTLDVWIDSGCSHHAVLDQHEELSAPADLYLEATDQHRGWFQSSLMLSLAARDTAPYKKVLTHGFVVDKDKKSSKLSKSDAQKSGKPIDAAHFYNKYGADIIRLWVSSVDWQNEVPFGEELFKQITEPYRRLRNTLRILLGNIPVGEQVAQPDLENFTLLDKWLMERLNELTVTVTQAYANYDFRKVFTTINQFCTSDLSALYIDITKDRMYCDGLDEPKRQVSVYVIQQVFNSLVKLLAPILAFTTEEAWQHAGYEGSVHEQDFPEVDSAWSGRESSALVEEVLKLRGQIQTTIEAQVQAKAFAKNNEALIELTLPESHAAWGWLQNTSEAKEFFIISDLVVQAGAELQVGASKSAHEMCPRCRRYEPIAQGNDCCDRCEQVMVTA
mgnify:FL=1